MPLATLYEWLMLVHVLAAMVWLGGLVALTALASHVLRSSDREAVARFIGSLRVVGPLVLAPASLLVLAFGIWMVVDDAAWDFGQTWVWLALALGGTFTYDSVRTRASRARSTSIRRRATAKWCPS